MLGEINEYEKKILLDRIINHFVIPNFLLFFTCFPCCCSSCLDGVVCVFAFIPFLPIYVHHPLCYHRVIVSAWNRIKRYSYQLTCGFLQIMTFSLKQSETQCGDTFSQRWNEETRKTKWIMPMEEPNYQVEW